MSRTGQMAFIPDEPSKMNFSRRPDGSGRRRTAQFESDQILAPQSFDKRREVSSLRTTFQTI